MDTNSFEISLDDAHAVKFGDSNDLQIMHSTHNYIYTSNGNIELRSTVGSDEAMIKCKPDDAVELYFDGSEKLKTQSWGTSFTGNVSPSADNQYDLGASGAQWNDLYIGNNIYLPDAGEVRLGNSGDLQLYHDGNNSVINDTGTGRLKLISSNVQIRNAANTETIAEFIQDGAVELYYNNLSLIHI